MVTPACQLDPSKLTLLAEIWQAPDAGLVESGTETLPIGALPSRTVKVPVELGSKTVMVVGSTITCALSLSNTVTVMSLIVRPA